MEVARWRGMDDIPYHCWIKLSCLQRLTIFLIALSMLKSTRVIMFSLSMGAIVFIVLSPDLLAVLAGMVAACYAAFVGDSLF